VWAVSRAAWGKPRPRSISRRTFKGSRPRYLWTATPSAPAPSGLSVAMGKGLPFHLIPVGQMARYVKDYTHIVIDTEANPSEDDFKEAAEGCDLLVIPAEPETTAKDGLIHTLS
jgi:hypothetical protein